MLQQNDVIRKVYASASVFCVFLRVSMMEKRELAKDVRVRLERIRDHVIVTFLSHIDKVPISAFINDVDEKKSIVNRPRTPTCYKRARWKRS